MKNKVHLSTESRIHREVYVRFGAGSRKTCRSNTTRRRVPSLHYIFDVEKKDSIKTLLLTLWKSEDDKVTKTESGELGSAVRVPILSASNPTVASCRRSTPSTSIYADDYRKELAQRHQGGEVRLQHRQHAHHTMRQYYRGGRYDFLLNSTENIDLLGKRFIVFEIDSIKETANCSPS